MFINSLETITAALFFCLLCNSAAQGAVAQNFTGFYRQVTPLCDKKLDENPRELPEYSGIRDCYEGKKRMGTAAEFWILQNEQSICGYWQWSGKKIWSGAFIGRVKNGGGDIFYADGHRGDGEAEQYVLKKLSSGFFSVSLKDSKHRLMTLRLVKVRLLVASLRSSCPTNYQMPVMLDEVGKLMVKNLPDEDAIQKAFGDVSEKPVYKAPIAKRITLDKQTKAFRYEDFRAGNNFVPRDVTVQNSSTKVWSVGALCNPESSAYFDFKTYQGEIKSQYRGYNIEAMDGSEIDLSPGKTIHLLSCRSFGVYFAPVDESDAIKR